MYTRSIYTGIPMHLTHARYHHHVTKELTWLISMYITNGIKFKISESVSFGELTDRKIWRVPMSPAMAKFTRLLRDLELNMISNKSRYIRLKDCSIPVLVIHMDKIFRKIQFHKQNENIYKKIYLNKGNTNSSWPTNQYLNFYIIANYLFLFQSRLPEK